MTLPANVDTTIVNGTFLKFDGTPAAGTVTFEAAPCRFANAPDVILLGVPIIGYLDVNGDFEVELPSTDDPDLNPVDWTYLVSVKLTDPSYGERFAMDAPAGAPIKLAEVIPIEGSVGDAVVVGPPGADGADGADGPPGPAGEGVPPGGNTGEVLAKSSAADFDSTWVPASAPGVHAITHAAGGTDPVTLTQAQITGLPAALTAKADDAATTAALAGKADAAATTTALAAKADKTTTIATTAPLAGGGDLSTNRTLTVATFGTSAAGVVPASGGGSTNYLRADGTWAAPAGAGVGVTDGDKGDVVVSGSGATWMLDTSVVTAAAKTVLDDTTTAAMLTTLGAAASATTVTATAPITGTGTLGAALTIGVSDFTTSVRGTVPASGGGTANFLRADGTWAARRPVVAGGITGITVSEVGSALDTDITTLDFLAGFDLTESPENEINIALDLTEYTGGALPVAGGGTGSTTAGAALTALGAAAAATAITGTAPITTSGTLGSAPTVAITDFTVSTRGAVPTPGGTSSGRFLMDDGTWTIPPTTSSAVGGVFPFMYSTTTTEPPTGSQIRGNNATFTSSTKLWIMETTTDGLDVTVGLGRIKTGFQVYVQDYSSSARYALFNVTADATDKGTYWEVTVALASSLGTVPAGKVAVQTLSSAQASKVFSTTTTAPGITPGSAGATTAFLRGDATWATPSTTPGASTITPAMMANGDFGDFTVASNVATVDAGVITLAKMANLAQDQFIGRTTASTGVPETATITAAARTVLDDTTTAAMLTTLGAQPVDADLTTIAGLTATTDNMIQSVGSAWASRTPAQVKTALALNNVDNTSDATKDAATSTLTNKTLTDPKINLAVNAQTGTTYTLVLTDNGKLITCNNASAVSVTVPPNSSVAFPTGTQITIIGIGAGIVTIVQGSGVTVNSTPSLVYRARYSAATLIKTGTDQWYLTGDLGVSPIPGVLASSYNVPSGGSGFAKYRTFNGSSDLVTWSLGNLSGVSANPQTLVAVTRLLSASADAVLMFSPGYDPVDWFYIWSAGTIAYFDGATNIAGPSWPPTGTPWRLTAIRSVSGSAAKWSLSTYNGSSWPTPTHTTASATLGARSYGTSGVITMGGTPPMNVDIVCLARFNTDLTDAAINGMTSGVAAIQGTSGITNLWKIGQTTPADAVGTSTLGTLTGTTLSSGDSPFPT